MDFLVVGSGEWREGFQGEGRFVKDYLFVRKAAVANKAIFSVSLKLL